ncbi:hypothetical protein NW758_006021 [Fusarium oxysporum]|nr:hypothetical protein NW758_006021 [Fusarium oxysporum]
MPQDSRHLWSSTYVAIEFTAHEPFPNILSLLIQNSPEDPETVKAHKSALNSTLGRIQERLEERKEPIVERPLLKVLWLLLSTSTLDYDIKSHVSKTLQTVQQRKEELRMLAKITVPKDSSKEKAVDPRRRDEHQGPEKGAEVERSTRGNEHSKAKQNKKKDPDYLTELEDILRAPSRTKFHQRLEGVAPLKDRSELPENVVANFEASITIFFAGTEESGTITRYRPIEDVIYGSGPQEIVAKTISAMSKITDDDVELPGYSIQSGTEPNFIWIHLPSTNTSWMDDLLTRIMEFEENKSQQYHEVKSFLQNSRVHVPNEKSQSRFLRPGIVVKHETMNKSSDQGGLEMESTQTEDDEFQSEEDVERKEGTMARDDPSKTPPNIAASAIYMPHFCVSRYSPCQDGADGSQTNNTKGARSKKDYMDLLKAYGKSAHESPTLDEWYCHFRSDDKSAEDKMIRNGSQVVTKYLREAQTESPDEGQEKSKTSGQNKQQNDEITLLRVNQLWAWIIADKWLITATSCHPNDCHSSLDTEILDQLDEKVKSAGSSSQPSSAIEMIKLIVKHCIGSFERPPNLDSGCEISPSQAFSHYLNRIGRDETALFEAFRQRTESWEFRDNGNRQKKIKQSTPPHSSTAKTESSSEVSIQASPNDEIRDIIKKTMQLFCDIKDVRDELNMLRSAAQHQNTVQKGLAGESTQSSRLLSRTILGNIKEMDIVAERIQLAVRLCFDTINFGLLSDLPDIKIG